jgi:hypothetical protein
MRRLLRWIGVELGDPPKFDGIVGVKDFLSSMEDIIKLENQVVALDGSLKANLA